MATYSAILSGGTTIIVSSGTTTPVPLASLASGDTLYVTSGATVVGLPISGTEIVQSAGTVIEETVASGGTISALNGAIVDDTMISGGTVSALSGAVVNFTGITSSGVQYIYSGGVASGTTVWNTSGAEVIYSGGSATSDTVDGGGSGFVANGQNGIQYYGGEIISSGGAASNDYINNHGVIDIVAGGTLSSVYVASGGEIVIDNTKTNNGNVAVSVTSLSPTDIELQVYRGNGQQKTEIFSTTLTGLYNSETITTSAAPNSPYTDLLFGTGGTIYACFLEGTGIQGGTVEKPVEELQPGDMVDTLVDGEIVPKPVKWVGSRSVTASQLPEEDAYPVRVRANAFGPGMPQRDLLITPEHCVFVDGRLTPIRMLVNGGSIMVDRSIGAYTFYHVELEQHGILLADGLATESYLDTGNRGNFANTEVPAMRPDLDVDAGHASWENDAAAPLSVDRAAVEPVWRRLAARAAEIGFAPVTAPAELVADHDLRLVTDEGWEIRPARHAGDRYSFMVPDGVNTLRLRSRAARPSEVVGPFLDDRRKLGVKVGEIRLLEGRQQIEITSHLGGNGLRGWHAIEAEGDTSRWTSGDAELPVALGNGPTLVEIQVVAGGPYLPEIADEGVALAG